MIRGVIFDLDGVLVTTDELHYRAWKRLADEEGLPFDRKTNHRLRGVSRMASLEIILELAPVTFTDERKHEMAERKNAYYRTSLGTLTPASVLPGALELLRALRARGIRTAVASSSRNAKTIMKRIGILHEVDALADGTDITRSKPDPEVFLIAASRIGVEPVECLVVEDAAAGIEAARRAGMAAFGIGSPAHLPAGTVCASGLAEVTVERLLGER